VNRVRLLVLQQKLIEDIKAGQISLQELRSCIGRSVSWSMMRSFPLPLRCRAIRALPARSPPLLSALQGWALQARARAAPARCTA